MTYPVFATGDVLPASDMNAIGLWLVKTQTIGTGVSSVTVTNAFSATYDNYLITVTGVTGSTPGAALYFGCVTSGGAANAANWSGNSVYVTTGSGGGFSNAADNNSLSVSCGGIYGGGAGTNNFNVNGPFLSQRTSVNYNSADETYFRVGAAVLKNATSYTGFNLAPNAGTMTGGTIRVYGYRN